LGLSLASTQPFCQELFGWYDFRLGIEWIGFFSWVLDNASAGIQVQVASIEGSARAHFLGGDVALRAH
jgi:hypothetical protein